MKTVTLRVANQSFSKLVHEIEKTGESFRITKRGKPIATLGPSDGRNQRSDDWQSAYEEMCRLLEEGLDLGGLRVNRDDLYDRP